MKIRSCIKTNILIVALSSVVQALLPAQCSESFILDHMGISWEELTPPKGSTTALTDEYVIPTVIHVFHDGERARISEEQVRSAIEVLNDDLNGLNDAWDEIEPRFDSIKATIDIRFCLAGLDPLGQSTSGIIYYDDPAAMRREKDLYQFAWENTNYFNIYLPEYVFDPSTNFTAFATLPNLSTIARNRDGVHYSSVRFGFGDDSQLDPGDDWASVITHEVGHWLGLQHTFQGGCASQGDGIDDTPPTTGGTIYLSGCNNEDESCGVPTNGSNFMDYNHRCKRMFTQGQVDRMLSVLNDIRSNMWSEDNLIATGCNQTVSTQTIVAQKATVVYPNPSSGHINIDPPAMVDVYNVNGQLVSSHNYTDRLVITTPGVYLLRTSTKSEQSQHKVVIW